MQPSPLQLRRVEFLSVSILPKEEPDVFCEKKSLVPFRFDGTRVLASISHALANDEEKSNHTNFLITFAFALPNDGKNPPPYLIDIRCVGYFSIVKKAFPDEVQRLDVGVVNGASMLYGIIRELVSNITCRSWYGELLLPSVNFQDQRPSLNQQSESTGVEPVQSMPKHADEPIAKKAHKPRKKGAGKI